MARPISEPAVHYDTSRGFGPGALPSQQPATDLLHGFLRGVGRIEPLERYAPLAARVLIIQIFLLSGVMKILKPTETMDAMASRGMFWIPFFLVAATAVELVGALSLLVGYKARLGALLLFLFLIPVTLTFHNWWTYADPKEQRDNMLFFLHNLTLMGGLLLFMTYGPGPFSLDLWRRRPS